MYLIRRLWRWLTGKPYPVHRASISIMRYRCQDCGCIEWEFDESDTVRLDGSKRCDCRQHASCSGTMIQEVIDIGGQDTTPFR